MANECKEFPLYFPERRAGMLCVPDLLSLDDITLLRQQIDASLSVIEATAALNEDEVTEDEVTNDKD